MNILGSLAIAFAMYSRIPVPQVQWSDQRMKYALCFFPAIGVVIGAALALWSWAAVRLAVQPVVFACGAAVIPLVITGGIHLDGFLDTTDARSSHLERERKLEILKDPHAGAFAFIGGSIYLLLTAGLFCELEPAGTAVYAGGFVLSRALSGYVLVTWPKARQDGLASTFSSLAETRRVKAAMVLWICACSFWFYITGGVRAVAWAGVAAVVSLIQYYRIKEEFGGVTGDLAGYFLQICELALLAAVVVGGRIGI